MIVNLTVGAILLHKPGRCAGVVQLPGCFL